MASATNVREGGENEEAGRILQLPPPTCPIKRESERGRESEREREGGRERERELTGTWLQYTRWTAAYSVQLQKADTISSKYGDGRNWPANGHNLRSTLHFAN